MIVQRTGRLGGVPLKSPLLGTKTSCETHFDANGNGMEEARTTVRRWTGGVTGYIAAGDTDLFPGEAGGASRDPIRSIQLRSASLSSPFSGTKVAPA